MALRRSLAVDGRVHAACILRQQLGRDRALWSGFVQGSGVRVWGGGRRLGRRRTPCRSQVWSMPSSPRSTSAVCWPSSGTGGCCVGACPDHSLGTRLEIRPGPGCSPAEEARGGRMLVLQQANVCMGKIGISDSRRVASTRPSCATQPRPPPSGEQRRCLRAGADVVKRGSVFEQLARLTTASQEGAQCRSV